MASQKIKFHIEITRVKREIKDYENQDTRLHYVTHKTTRLAAIQMSLKDFEENYPEDLITMIQIHPSSTRLV